MVAIPILALLAQAVQSTGEIWSHIASTVLPVAIRNTLILLLGVGVLVAALGTGSAWLVTAYAFPGRSVVEWALLLPLAVPTYIVAFVYLEVLHPIGPVQTTLRAVLGYTSPQQFHLPDIRSMAGCTLLLGFVLYPYVYVATRALFMMQAANFIDASRTLGVSRRAVFWRVALPLARPAIAVGTSLALMETLNDIGASEFLGIRTLTVSIYSTWINGADLPGAALLAVTLLTVVFAVINLERWARRKQRFSNSAQRSTRLVPRKLPTAQGLGALVLCLIPIIIGFAAPTSYLVVAASHRIQFAGVSKSFLTTIGYTLLFAVGAAILTLLLGTIVAYARRLRPGSLSKICIRVATLGYAAPGTVIAIGVLIPLAGLDQAIDVTTKALFGFSTGLLLIGSGTAMVYAYCVRFLAVSAGSVEAGLSRIPLSLDRASRSLGQTSAGTLWNVHLPLAKPALAAAGLLLFVDCVKELPATLLLRPLNVETLATQLYAEASRGTYEDGSIAALCIVMIGILPLILLARVGRNGLANLK
jgi:iron(III) transport system permease protein